MPIFAYSIAADQDRPSEGDGFVRAETIQQAVALVGHPEVNVRSCPKTICRGVVAEHLTGPPPSPQIKTPRADPRG